MQNLNLPDYKFKLKSSDNAHFIFDAIRKKYVTLTPEEWVRQNFIKYLMYEKKYNPLFIAVEKEISLNNQKKRFDIVAYSTELKPVVLIECKSPDVKITQKVFDQIASYNISLKVDYLIVTNGLAHYCCIMDYKKNTYNFINYLPDYSIFK